MLWLKENSNSMTLVLSSQFLQNFIFDTKNSLHVYLIHSRKNIQQQKLLMILADSKLI